MKDIKIVEPRQEVVDIPKHDIYYIPFARLNDIFDWNSIMTLTLPKTIDEAKLYFKGFKDHEKMILKIYLPSQYLEEKPKE